MDGHDQQGTEIQGTANFRIHSRIILGILEHDKRAGTQTLSRQRTRRKLYTDVRSVAETGLTKNVLTFAQSDCRTRCAREFGHASHNHVQCRAGFQMLGGDDRLQIRYFA